MLGRGCSEARAGNPATGPESFPPPSWLPGRGEWAEPEPEAGVARACRAERWRAATPAAVLSSLPPCRRTRGGASRGHRASRHAARTLAPRVGTTQASCERPSSVRPREPRPSSPCTTVLPAVSTWPTAAAPRSTWVLGPTRYLFPSRGPQVRG